MSRKSASTFALSAKNVSGYSSTRQEFCKIGVRGRRPDKGNSCRRVGESLPKRSTGAETVASGKGSKLGQREDILLRAQKAALALNPKPAFGFTSAANPVLPPKPEPWTLREHFLVSSIVASQPAVEQLQNAVDATAELPYDSVRCLRSPQIP